LIDTLFPLPADATGVPPPDEFFIASNGTGYLAVKGRYRKWNDFHAMCLSLFTENYFNELNRGEGPGAIYMEHNGYTYYQDVTAGNNFAYTPPDTFLLISESSTMINFNVIGHYNYGTPALGKSFPSEALSFPIAMVLTDNGWRFSEFSVTN